VPRPLCFMIMPFGRKATQAVAGRGPAEIDFNALWDKCYVPVIDELGYEAVRADQDTGALIIKQMLQRLYFADLVLAEMTIPNGNVYYEVGIRHAAKETGCVLLAADWSVQLFDTEQMRTIKYPLPEGDVSEATAEAFRNFVKDRVAKLINGLSPMHDSIKGYPGNVNPADASSMQGQLTDLAAFQAKVRAVRAAPRLDQMKLAEALVASDGKPPMTVPVAIALLRLLRDSTNDSADWKAVVDFARNLPEGLADQAEGREQLAFAISHTGDVTGAIGQLESLIYTVGPTPERLGLLGGRYKRLFGSAKSDEERARYLNNAIQAYEKGMDLDLNDYYCSSNLPRLYRKRKRNGDEERAQRVLTLVIAACERAKRRGVTEEWLRATLLGAAFDAADADKAEELADDVEADDPVRWKLKSTLDDAEGSANNVADATIRGRLLAVIARLRPYETSGAATTA
jgi:Tetratricopeptide Repeats-Sensor